MLGNSMHESVNTVLASLTRLQQAVVCTPVHFLLLWNVDPASFGIPQILLKDLLEH